MRKPLFMEGTGAVANDALKISDIDPARIRGVSWAPSPAEPAMLEDSPITAVPPPPPATAPTLPPAATEPAVSPHFEPLPSEPARSAFTSRGEEQLRAALEALKAQGERLAEQARSDALELGILIARRILERELSANLEGVFALVKSAIRRVGEDHVTRVRMSVGDVARFEKAADSAFSLGKIELVADPTLSGGDVMVDTDHHTIDGRLSTRLEELVRQLDGTPT